MWISEIDWRGLHARITDQYQQGAENKQAINALRDAVTKRDATIAALSEQHGKLHTVLNGIFEFLAQMNLRDEKAYKEWMADKELCAAQNKEINTLRDESIAREKDILATVQNTNAQLGKIHQVVWEMRDQHSVRLLNVENKLDKLAGPHKKGRK